MTSMVISNPHHVRIVEVEPFFSTEQLAGTFAFGASTAVELTLAHVRVRVESRNGQSATGWGAIFLSHGWAYPISTLAGPAKDALMRDLIGAIGQRLTASSEFGHPIDHFRAIEPELPAIAAEVAARHGSEEPVPPLCSLVCLSPIDAAIHDAYGKLHGASSYALLGADHLGWDLGDVLGPSFAGRYPGEFLRPQPVATLPISHTVGAIDPLTTTESGSIDALDAWVAKEGLWSFKVKLKGQDLDWDLARLQDVHRVARAANPDHEIRVFADLNEQAPGVDYIQELLDRLAVDGPAVRASLDALEQPLSRVLEVGAPSLASISAQVPVVLDEGLVSLEAMRQALDLGWSGIALKTCKTQSLMLLALPLAVERNLHLTVQDLTNPGIALIQSVGLAARLPVTRPIETNARQYVPHTSAPELAAHPWLHEVADGTIVPTGLGGPGLGYVLDLIPREIFRG